MSNAFVMYLLTRVISQIAGNCYTNKWAIYVGIDKYVDPAFRES
jgi:hypothetical protein